MEELQTYYQIPSIAHFCNLFRHSLHLPDFDYEDLEFALLSDIPPEEFDSGSAQSHLILRLICTLLKGYFNTYINHTNWEKYLKKLFQIQWVDIEKKRSPFIGYDDKGEEISISFNDLPLRTKVNVIHCLCDYRLFADDISQQITEINAEDYRVEPLATDSKGYTYWYFYGTRLYREHPTVANNIETNFRNFDDSVHKRAEDIRRSVESEKLKEAKRLKEESKKKRLPPKVLGLRTGLRTRKSDQSVPNGVHPSTDTSDNTSIVEIEDKKSEFSAKDVKELSVSLKQKSEAWSLICSTEQDWKDLCSKFEKSKSKSETDFYKLLSKSFLPKISEIFENQEKERQRIERQKLIELLPRRLSSRIELKKIQKEKEELEEQAVSRRRKDESLQRNNETDRQRSERIKQERELRAQKRLQLVEERAERALKRDRMDLYPDSQSSDPNMDTSEPTVDYISEDFINEISVSPTNTVQTFYEGLEKVINAVKSNRDAWPFAEAVDGTKFPMYYQVIEEPIDLSVIESKVENKNYENFEELEKDFKQMVNNCETFNGPKNGYTLMAYGVWRAFKRSALKHMHKELSHDESTAFIYPQKSFNTNIKPAIEAKKKKMQNKRRSTLKALHVLAKAAEKAVVANESRTARSTASTTSSISEVSMDSNTNSSTHESTVRLNSYQIHGDMLANFLFNANTDNTITNPNSNPFPNNTTPENLTFKSLDEWSESIKQSGNCVVLPQNAVIISSNGAFTHCTNGPVVKPQVSLRVVSTGVTTTSGTHFVNTDNTSNLFTSSVISNNENAGKELVNTDPKRLVIKLSRCEAGEVWRPVTLITTSPQKSFNTITVNSNQTNGQTITSSAQQFQGLRNIETNCVPIKKRFVIQDINKSVNEHNSGLNMNPIPNSNNHSNPISQSFQITGIQRNQNSNLKVFRLKKMDQNLNQNQSTDSFHTNILPTNESPVIPKPLPTPSDKQTSNGNGLSSGL